MTDSVPHQSTAIAAEYVADQTVLPDHWPAPSLTDLDGAADELIALLEARLTAITEAADGPLGLMISGGIDSILLAACCHRLGIAPNCLTVVATEPGHDGDADTVEDLRGRDVAAVFGFTHHVVHLQGDTTIEAARNCVARLGTTELWEITSAVPIEAAFRRFDELGVTGPVLSGAGSDAVFLGGDVLAADPNGAAGLAEYRERVLRQVRRNFTRHRLIPDYYERLLADDAHRYVQTFQTGAFVDFAMTIDPSLLWRVGAGSRIFDKYLLRHTAAALGVPAEYVWTKKAPLQVSSGTVGALAGAARATLAADPANTTYTDPRTEPLEHTVVRLFLQTLAAGT